MVLNYEFDDNRSFARDRFSRRLSMLIAVARELNEDVNVAERHMAKSGKFVISIQVGSRSQLTHDFGRLKEVLGEMGGKFTSFTLIATEEFRGLMDK